MGKLSIDKGRGKTGARRARSFSLRPRVRKPAKGDKDMKDKKRAEYLILAALDLARRPTGKAELRAGKAELKEAFGQGFRVKKSSDVLITLLASAIFFSNEA